MGTLVILDCKIKPGYSVEAVRTTLQQLPDTRAFEGCQGIECFREHAGQTGTVTDFVTAGVHGEPAEADGATDSGDRLVLVEYWDSLAAYHKYVTWRTATRDLPNFVEMCDGPPVLRTFDLMDGSSCS
jgi:quinol monooxygenase YgiN